MRSKVKSYLTLLIGWPLSGLALFFLLQRIIPEWGKISSSIHNISLPLLLYGVLSFLTYYFLRSYAWSLLLNAKGYSVKLSDTTFLWGISEVKRYIPGSIWSFLGRTMSFSEKGVLKKDTGYLLVVEAGLVFLSAIFIALLSIPFVFKYFFIGMSLPSYLVTLSVLFITVASTCYAFQEKIARILPKKF